MPILTFAPALARWRTAEPSSDVASWSISASGATLRELLDDIFRNHPALRGYVLDERGALRHHIVVFVDGEPLRDKQNLGNAIASDADVQVFQALSGG
jgi:molybdopterin synthase sulfur carrier subunit